MCRTTRRRIHADASVAFHGLCDGTGLVASQSGITAESQLHVLIVSCVARVADIPVAVADVIGAHGSRQSRVHDDRDRMHPVRTVPGTARTLRRLVLDSSIRVGTAAAAAVAASAATAILLEFKSSPAPSDVPVRFRSAHGSASWSASAERRSRRSDRRERIRPRVSSCFAGAVDHPRSAPSSSSSAAPAASLPSADVALAGSTADGNLFAGQCGVR